MTILIFFLFLAFLAVISSLDTKKAKKIIITADVILLSFVILSFAFIIIDDMVFKNKMFSSPVRDIVLFPVLGSFAMILLFTAVLIVKISGSKSK